MKIVLQNIIDNDTSYRKRHSSQYLYKYYPEVWQSVLELTKFLPNTAAPKQRVWHILRDIWAIPKCPETNQEVKWFDNRYLTYSSLKASRKDVAKKLSNLTKGDKHWRSKDTDKAKKANKNFTANLKAGNHKPFDERDRDYDTIVKKSKQTCLEKYGVLNGSQTKEAKEKIYQKAVERGCTRREERSLRRLYYDAVWKITEESWKNHFDEINPNRINRTYNALDHIYSIQQGFRDCIPPYIIGHYTNLRVIGLSENGIKGMRCDKSKDQLFGDFFG
jgi:hypothetical protein